MLRILENDKSFFWFIDGKVETGNLNNNSKLQELSDFFVFKYNIEISDYGKVEFLFQNMTYDDFNLRLEDIGLFSDYLIIVKKETFSTAPMRPCTRYDRDHYRDYPDGIRFELSLGDKSNFILMNCLSNSAKIGTYIIEVLKYKLARTDNRFEISAIQKILEEIQNLTQSYLSEIRKSLDKIE